MDPLPSRSKTWKAWTNYWGWGKIKEQKPIKLRHFPFSFFLEGILLSLGSHLFLGSVTLPASSAVLDGEVLIVGELLVKLSLEDLSELSLSGVLANGAEEVGDILSEDLALVELVEDVEGLLGLCDFG